MLPKPRYGTFLSTLLGLGVQPNENDILQLIPSRCERSRGENGESGERLSRGRTELPLIASSCRLDRAPHPLLCFSLLHRAAGELVGVIEFDEFAIRAFDSLCACFFWYAQSFVMQARQAGGESSRNVTAPHNGVQWHKRCSRSEQVCDCRKFSRSPYGREFPDGGVLRTGWVGRPRKTR